MDDDYEYGMVAEATKVSECDQDMPQLHTTVNPWHCEVGYKVVQ